MSPRYWPSTPATKAATLRLLRNRARIAAAIEARDAVAVADAMTSRDDCRIALSLVAIEAKAGR